jgi:hypothetical protein
VIRIASVAPSVLVGIDHNFKQTLLNQIQSTAAHAHFYHRPNPATPTTPLRHIFVFLRSIVLFVSFPAMDDAPAAAAASPESSPEQKSPSDSPELSPDRPPLSPTLSFTNGDIYEALDDDWLIPSSDTGELSLFAFLDNLNFLPETLDRLNQRLRRESREVTRHHHPAPSRVSKSRADFMNSYEQS